MTLRHILVLSLTITLGYAGCAEAARVKPVIDAISPEGGASGVGITVTGSHFGRKGRLLFGSRQAKVQNWSDTRIDATVPKGKGSVKLRIKSRRYGLSKPRIFAYSEASTFSGAKVIANNDLGMHCVDESFKVFSILPPYNVVNAQVLAQDADGRPRLLDESQVSLRYSAVSDASGSINSTSLGKTDFWEYAKSLYGADLLPGQGLKGLYMPADAPADAPPVFGWNSGLDLFSAEGVPILPVDDGGFKNRYPLMRVTAYDKSGGAAVASVDAVLPVSEETTCRTCHSQGAAAADDPSIEWASAGSDPENSARLNVLKLHDAKEGTHLEADKPVLCAACHYSPALDLAGAGPNPTQQAHPSMSKAMHAYHAGKMQGAKDEPDLPGQPVVEAAQQSCYECHPGRSTECLRGAMTATVTCQNCHGDMQAVGGTEALKTGGGEGGLRRPWVDEPRCESCHTGDANQHAAGQLAADGIRRYLAYDPVDTAATPRSALNPIFAENTGKLFRHSKGHGGIACEGCHGSTHAIWPTDDLKNPNDNVAAKHVQGHSGTLMECTTCHRKDAVPMGLDGPHGMHPVDDQRWVSGHEDYAEHNLSACSACHGQDFRGSVLSVAVADRSYTVEEKGTRTIKKGEQVGCYTCHDGPTDD
ncbi:IPT/TIG domain-containing protein [Methyloterricola oryzae]|uniref:IPT/TIG domain-containing protein n=1 Tax=Methyloterricola oryzae TaxID=1495050 RepID=UPI0009E26C16|nr:IPT/TIG domain-containing protein [Methyloterricola oryzae]